MKTRHAVLAAFVILALAHGRATTTMAAEDGGIIGIEGNLIRVTADGNYNAKIGDKLELSAIFIFPMAPDPKTVELEVSDISIAVAEDLRTGTDPKHLGDTGQIVGIVRVKAAGKVTVELQFKQGATTKKLTAHITVTSLLPSVPGQSVA